MDAHIAKKVSTDWAQLLDMASASGVSSYTVFSILNLFAKHD